MTGEVAAVGGKGPGRLMKLLVKTFSRWNAKRYLQTSGASMGSFGGRDICVASMTGARTGQRRDVPLMYVPYKHGVILVASLGGASTHPLWYHNLIKDPVVDVQVKDNKLKLCARLASAQEKAEVWPVCVEYYSEYATYQARTTRDIPVFICEPREAG